MDFAKRTEFFRILCGKSYEGTLRRELMLFLFREKSEKRHPKMVQPCFLINFRKGIVARFGEQGGYAGCWCMFWRLDRADFKKLRGGGTKEILLQMAEKNQQAGLLTCLAGNLLKGSLISPAPPATASQTGMGTGREIFPVILQPNTSLSGTVADLSTRPRRRTPAPRGGWF